MICNSSDRPEIFSKYLGDTEKYIRQLFQKARKLAPCVIFFDEMDALGAKRGEVGDDEESGGAVYRRVLTQLLTEMDGLVGRDRVFMIGCTNRPDMLDSALLRPGNMSEKSPCRRLRCQLSVSGRFDTLLEVPPPSVSDREKILRLQCRHLPVAPSVDFARLAEVTEGFTGADLSALCRYDSRVYRPAHLKLEQRGLPGCCALSRPVSSGGAPRGL